MSKVAPCLPVIEEKGTTVFSHMSGLLELNPCAVMNATSAVFRIIGRCRDKLS
jgi:hypothetical protein